MTLQKKFPVINATTYGIYIYHYPLDDLTATLNVRKFYILAAVCVYVFCVVLRQKNNYSSAQR